MKKNAPADFKLRSIVLLQGMFAPEFYDALAKRKFKNVVVLEGRPSFDSSREACQQLLKHRITPIVIADNTAGFLFSRNFVKEVWIAYQTSDAKGCICEIGALIVAVLGKTHRIAVDAAQGIPQKRFLGSPDDVCCLAGQRTAPVGVKGYVPLVEFVPQKYFRRIHV